jgi:Flp pilus assembly protein CpaB
MKLDPLLVVMAVLAVLGGGFVMNATVNWVARAVFEARQKDKRIELGMLIVAALALVLSIVSIFWQAYQSDHINQIEDRLKKIEGPRDPTVIPPPAQ